MTQPGEEFRVFSGFDYLSQRCAERIPTLYRPEQWKAARTILAAELTCIAHEGLSARFCQTLELVAALRRQGYALRMVGSGCSSLVSFLMELSDVDPVRYRLPFERFYATSNHRTPDFQFDVGHVENRDELKSSLPYVRLRLMTPAEKAVWLTPLPGPANREHSEDTPSHVLALFLTAEELEIVRQLKLRTVMQLAIVTSLSQVGIDQPKAAGQFAQSHFGISKTVCGRRRLARPVLFQERLMSKVVRRTGVSLEEAYEFIKAASAGRLYDANIGYRVRQQLLSRCGAGDEAEQQFQSLTAAAVHSVCLSHQLANAKTIHRAIRLSQRAPTQFYSALVRFGNKHVAMPSVTLSE